MKDTSMNRATTSLDEILQEANALLEETEAPKVTKAPPAKPSKPAADPRQTRDDRLLIGLMATGCVLCVGIIAILAYWLDLLG